MAAEVKPDAMTELTQAFGDVSDVLAQYNVKTEDIRAPEVQVTTMQNFEALCTNLGAVEYKGIAVEHDGHTGPLMLLHIPTDYIPGDRYEGYVGYYPITVLRGPQKPGDSPLKVVVTYSTKEEDDDLVKLLKSYMPGNIFTVARIPTTSGFHVYRAIPAQKPSAI